MENLGIDPSTSRMQSERSTVWANPPVIENLGEKLATKPRLKLKLIAFKAEQIKTRGKWTELYSAELSKVNYIIILYIKIPNHV